MHHSWMMMMTKWMNQIDRYCVCMCVAYDIFFLGIVYCHPIYETSYGRLITLCVQYTHRHTLGYGLLHVPIQRQNKKNDDYSTCLDIYKKKIVIQFLLLFNVLDYRKLIVIYEQHISTESLCHRKNDWLTEWLES
mgnify:CR=1 FL=1